MRPMTVLLLAACLAPAQPQAASPAFEVASVKAHQGPMMRSGVATSGLRLDGLTTVRGLIMFAYNLKNPQVSLTGAPYAAVGDTFYDVEAKAPDGPPPSRDDFRRMLQTLLAERFHLAAHREMHDTPVYELLVGKRGPKLKPAAPDASGPSQVHVQGRNYQIVIPKGRMSDLVEMLESAGFAGRPVIDKTALAGAYEIQLTYTPDIRSNRENPQPGDISILQAVEEQLGLRLEPAKAPLEVLVVDRIEKPAAN